jgi:hypothetical protein
MSRYTRLEVTASPVQPLANPDDPAIIDALYAATKGVWQLNWDVNPADGTFFGEGTNDLSGSEQDLASEISAAVRTVLPDANVQVGVVDYDSAPMTTYQFGPGPDTSS